MAMTDIRKLKAKNDKGTLSSTIISHSLATARLAIRVLDNWLLSKSIMSREQDSELSGIRKAVATAAMLHDIGKITDDFQKKLKKNVPVIDNFDEAQPIDADWENPKSRKQQYYRHNVMSWALALKMINFRNSRYTDKILSAVLYHHVVYQKDIYTIGCNSTTAGDAFSILSTDERHKAKELISELSRISSDEFGTSFKLSSTVSSDDKKLEEQNLTVKITDPSVSQSYNEAAKYTIIRTVLINADRMLATYPELESHIISNDFSEADSLIKHIDVLEHADAFKDFDMDSVKSLYDKARFDKQLDTLNIASDFFNKNGGTFKLSASAGWGKTLFGILYTIMTGKKTIWVLPINLIADGTYRSIKSEIERMKLQDKLSVGLYMKGSYVYGDENSDILIMIIDSFLAPLYRNTDAHLFIRRLGCNVIFDEYHEFFTGEPLFAGFINTMFARNWYTDSNTLLMSATPRTLQVFELFSKYGKFIEYRPEPFNGNMNIKVRFKKVLHSSSLNITSNDAFVIMPTISSAQEVYEKQKASEDDILHSRFIDSDRKIKEERLYSAHDKHSIREDRNVEYGTHILITGNDISANSVYEVPMCPDKTIQAVFGRCGRFMEKFYKNKGNYYVVEVTDKDQRAAITKLRNQMLSDELCKRWIEMLREYDGKTMTKNELYALWEKFYRDNRADIQKAEYVFIREAYRSLYDMRPYATRKRNQESDVKILPSKPGWRGENNTIFVIPENIKADKDAIKIDSTSVEFLDDEWNHTAMKKKTNFMMRRIPNFKYIFRNGKYMDKKEMFRYAKNENTPLLLTTFVYRSDIGLVSNRTIGKLNMKKK